MKLCYRGLSYEYNPPIVEMGKEHVGGTYRGLEWRFREVRKAPVLQTNLDLKYRGIPYHVGSSQPVTVPVSVSERARELMLQSDRNTKNRQHSMLRRLANEVGCDRPIGAN
ncbi:DUF4278 domain-containing protein [Roseofilum casamattae]|uniref:DUF4278 domain-containing protein n=1 Tax=Roseofilum casamattae BLCC-M143 TaxID=3022442 RepID=A0ABT7BYU5_9CYAN|nr:DUF4278 domain-containing protein [Roseofilum casamattae]MDJ1183621.1 DUF4278 domain-containing protein [Roseofilum casamattae BLCC-M143]